MWMMGSMCRNEQKLAIDVCNILYGFAVVKEKNKGDAGTQIRSYNTLASCVDRIEAE